MSDAVRAKLPLGAIDEGPPQVIWKGQPFLGPSPFNSPTLVQGRGPQLPPGSEGQCADPHGQLVFQIVPGQFVCVCEPGYEGWVDRSTRGSRCLPTTSTSFGDWSMARHGELVLGRVPPSQLTPGRGITDFAGRQLVCDGYDNHPFLDFNGFAHCGCSAQVAGVDSNGDGFASCGAEPAPQATYVLGGSAVVVPALVLALVFAALRASRRVFAVVLAALAAAVGGAFVALSAPWYLGVGIALVAASFPVFLALRPPLRGSSEPQQEFLVPPKRPPFFARFAGFLQWLCPISIGVNDAAKQAGQDMPYGLFLWPILLVGWLVVISVRSKALTFLTELAAVALVAGIFAGPSRVASLLVIGVLLAEYHLPRRTRFVRR